MNLFCRRPSPLPFWPGLFSDPTRFADFTSPLPFFFQNQELHSRTLACTYVFLLAAAFTRFIHSFIHSFTGQWNLQIISKWVDGHTIQLKRILWANFSIWKFWSLSVRSFGSIQPGTFWLSQFLGPVQRVPARAHVWFTQCYHMIRGGLRHVQPNRGHQTGCPH